MAGLFDITFNHDFIIRFLSITLIDLALSGDNAIVIGMAAASLPLGQRKWVILGGAILAIILRIVLTSIATLLVLIPFLSAVGGCVLFWVAWRLLKIDTAPTADTCKDDKNATKNFRQAIVLIVTADFMMSLDNIIAIAGAAHGNIFLLIAGLLISMPLLMGTGGAISLLIDKFKWLVYVGAAVICFTGIRMIFEDKIIEPLVPLSAIAVVIISAVCGLAITWLFYFINKRRAASCA